MGDMIKKVYVVFKTHYDIGYTALSKEVIAKYGTVMLGDVIKTCQKSRSKRDGKRYVWTMPSWPLLESLKLENTTQDNREKAIELIKDGQIAWHALPFTTHTEFCGLEELVRGFKFSTSLSLEFGKWPLSSKMTDVPGHTWILPTILAKSGVKFLHLGCNSCCIPPSVPRLFWWEGPDGSRILTFYNKGGYGSDFLPPDNWEYPVWLALMHTNDNIGPQNPNVIDEIENAMEEVLPESEVFVGTMDDFYNEIIKCNLDIPVIKKDIADSWIHGVGTYPKEVSILRKSRKRLLESEKIISYASIFNVISREEMKKVKSDINKAFELGLLFGEHTWGLDVKTTMRDFRHYSRKEFLNNKESTVYSRMEESWNEQRERANYVQKISENLYDVCCKNLTSNYKPGKNGKYIVFNTIGQKRDAWIDISNCNKIQPKALVDTRDGSPINIVKSDEHIYVYVKEMPAFGYVVLEKSENTAETYFNTVCQIEKTQDSATIENDYYKIVVCCKSGLITSLLEKKNNKEWIDKNVSEFAGYQYDIYSNEDITEFIRSYSYRFTAWIVDDLGRIIYPECRHQVYRPECISVDVSKENTGAFIFIKHANSGLSNHEYGDADEVTTSIFLPSFSDTINIHFELKGKHETSMVEAGHFVFPINIEKPRYRINKVGSVIDPSIDICQDANNGLYCLEDWVDINNGSNGICFISRDIPLFSIGQKEIYSYKNQYEERKPTLFFNAFNNSWGTNFPQWIGGNFAFEFTLFTHEGDWQEGKVAQKVTEIVNTPFVVYDESLLIEKTMESELFDCNGNIEIIALKSAEHEEDTFVLRIRETIGKDGDFKLKPSSIVKSVFLCDLQERAGVLLKSENSMEYIIETKPFEIHSFLLKI